MRAILILLCVCSLLMASCTKVTLDRGVIKDKFATSSKYGEAYYHATTATNVYDITSAEYAKYEVGDHLIIEESQFNGHVFERGTICAAWGISACIMIVVAGLVLGYFITKP